MSDDEEANPGYFEQLNIEDIDVASPVSIFRLARAHVSAKENAPSDRFHLRFTLGCGSGVITGAESTYVVRMRSCTVDMDMTGCDAEMHDAYKYDLPPEVYTEHISEDVSRDSEIDLKGSVKVGFGSKLLSFFSLKAGGEGSAHSKNGTLSKTRIESQRHISLIACNGSYWTVGDWKKGDPRSEGGMLNGQYFNEDRDKSLCSFTFQRGIKEAIIRFQVRARIGSLLVELCDVNGVPYRLPSSVERSDAHKALKERLRGIAIGQWMSKDQAQRTFGTPSNEVVVAAVGIKAVRD